MRYSGTYCNYPIIINNLQLLSQILMKKPFDENLPVRIFTRVNLPLLVKIKIDHYFFTPKLINKSSINYSSSH